MKIYSILLSALMSITLAVPAMSATSSNNTFNAAQTEAIEKIVHDYLIKKPEVIIEAYHSLQQKERTSAINQAKKLIPENAKVLFETNEKYVVGNSKGNVTLVEFFDYQCGYCRQVAPVIEKIIANDKNVRVIYKDFPIIDSNSELAARAALAAANQNKYQQFHDALIKASNPLNMNTIMKTAESVGLNTSQLKKDMNNKQITQILAENLNLAQKFRLAGTPAFIIARYPFNNGSPFFFLPGFSDEATLNALIKRMRQ